MCSDLSSRDDLTVFKEKYVAMCGEKEEAVTEREGVKTELGVIMETLEKVSEGGVEMLLVSMCSCSLFLDFLPPYLTISANVVFLSYETTYFYLDFYRSPFPVFYLFVFFFCFFFVGKTKSSQIE